MTQNLLVDGASAGAAPREQNLGPLATRSLEGVLNSATSPCWREVGGSHSDRRPSNERLLRVPGMVVVQ